ncbi:peptidyl-prolyl cis-trans isomerase, FKBP-type domain-containing protein [Toxoplasma gondii CAST]|uniref:peptidylprolyl isomerase n=1 Tax=Toxoplasma gondii CAST TaxID=943122 RepID=A0A3R7YKD6_TOXGO|nr:peptidyl-prolyl cis-trans isomerase, FKBP-type domain-containing protein [Toxoplasma gondii CAST]
MALSPFPSAPCSLCFLPPRYRGFAAAPLIRFFVASLSVSLSLVLSAGPLSPSLLSSNSSLSPVSALLPSGALPVLFPAWAVVEEYAELEETGEQSHHRRQRIDVSVPSFEAHSALQPSGVEAEKSFFSWESYHSRVLICEACQCLSSLVLELLTGSGTTAKTETESVGEESRQAQREGEAETRKSDVERKGEGERQPAQERKAGQDQVSSRERQSVGATSEVRGAAVEQGKGDTKESHKGSGEAETDGRASEKKGLEIERTRAAEKNSREAAQEKRRRTERIIALDQILEANKLCSFGYWKPFADKTEELTVREMQTACRSLLAAESESISSFLATHPEATGRSLSEFLCLPERCTSLWREDDLPAKRENQAERNLRLGRAFLRWNRDQPGIIETDSGLQFRMIKPNHDHRARHPKGERDLIHMHYLGKRLNGETFQNTFSRGHAAVVELGKLVPGWQEALKILKTGEEMHAYLPPEIAFGELGVEGKIGPNEVLLLHIRLEYIEYHEHIPPHYGSVAALPRPEFTEKQKREARERNKQKRKSDASTEGLNSSDEEKERAARAAERRHTEL